MGMTWRISMKRGLGAQLRSEKMADVQNSEGVSGRALFSVDSVPEPEDSSPVLTWILSYFFSLPRGVSTRL